MPQSLWQFLPLSIVTVFQQIQIYLPVATGLDEANVHMGHGKKCICINNCHILSTDVAYFCVIADNDPHNLIYSRILLMLISLYEQVP